jgi:hypothetical protein
VMYFWEHAIVIIADIFSPSDIKKFQVVCFEQSELNRFILYIGLKDFSFKYCFLALFILLLV